VPKANPKRIVDRERSAPNNLPVRLSSFIGRDAELDGLDRVLASAKLVTLTGPGGCGKTRLALRSAAAHVDRFPDGVWWVDLAPVRQESLVPEVIAGAMGIRDQAANTSLDQIVRHVASRSMLVILDNCEHVLESLRPITSEILRSSTESVVLATSQQPLSVEGEHVEVVPPLAVPTADEHDVTAAANSDAVELFIERARAAGTKRIEDVAVVVEICRRLDGMPLALELAAARTRALTPREILESLDQRLELFAGGPRTAHPRHRSLLASLQWSHELLDEPEQMLFRRLCVFVGGFASHAVEDVCAFGELDRRMVRDTLLSLVEKSFVQANADGDRTRYSLLETMRDYGLRRLAEAGESEVTRDRHASHFVELMESLEPTVSLADRAAIDRTALEHANVRAALDRIVERGDGPCALRLVSASSTALWIRGVYNEGKSWFERALAIPVDASGSRAKALGCLADMSFYAGDFGTLLTAGNEALAIARSTGDERTIARTLSPLGAGMALVDQTEGRRMLQESIDIARRVDDKWCLVLSLLRLAYSWLMQQERIDEPTTLLAECAAVAREIGALTWDDWITGGNSWVAANRGDLTFALDEATADERTTEDIVEPMSRILRLIRGAVAAADLGRVDRAVDLSTAANEIAEHFGGNLFVDEAVATMLAHVARARGDLVSMRACIERARTFAQQRQIPFISVYVGVRAGEALIALGATEDARATLEGVVEIAERLANDLDLARARIGLGRIALRENDADAAQRNGHSALAALVSGSYWRWVPAALDLLAAVVETHPESIRLYACAQKLREDIGLVTPPDERRALDGQLDQLREAVGPDAFDLAWTEGMMLSRDDAIAYAQRTRGKRKRPTSGWASLTPAEEQVTALAAEGLSNVEIGRRLFITPGTAKTHLSHIYAKLGLANRAELAAAAARRGV
jgi:predicted ATPase/DNA-binding CsgD family transcriptional regulator